MRTDAPSWLSNYVLTSTPSRDMLARHLVGHDPSEQRESSPRLERAIRACKSCVKSKAKCGNQRPCRRCVARRIPCQYSMLEGTSEGISTGTLLDIGPLAEDPGLNASSYPDALIPLRTDEPTTQAFLYPDFQSLMMSDYQTSQEIDFFYGQLTGWPNEAMLQDSGTLLEQSPGRVELGLSEQSSSLADGTLSVARSLRTSSSQSFKAEVPGWSAFRHDAFKRSLWVWVPTRQSAFLDCQHLSVDETLVMQDREAKVTQQCALTLPRITESGAREGILSLALQFAGFQPSLESFPSLTTFNLLMQTFFVREHLRVDSVVHPATFDPNQCRHDLLAAIIGAGTTMFAVTSAQKLGFSLQEIVRRAVCAVIVEDYTMSATLQAIQACFFWFEAGLWSGVKKKMEIAEGFAHAVPSVRPPYQA